MNNAEVLIKFKGDTTDSDKAIKSTTSSLGSLTKAFTIGGLATKAVTKALEVFNSGLDDSINRIDTMNNFSTVMENLGIATEDSSEVIKSLSEELVGLPTTLNSAASSVQRLTSYNGDIKKSEQYFLAMNNAIIAGTNDAGMQASAMEQLTQAYTKGKPDMQDWKTLLQAMPAQLKQVATAMGYVQTDDLYNALKNGEVSMNDFMDTLVELNTTGIDGFANLNDQARANIAGIGTSIANMKTAFVRGIGNIVKSIDASLESIGGLSGVISMLGKVGEQVFSSLGEVIPIIIPPLVEIAQIIMPALKDVLATIMPTLAQVIQTIMPALVQIIQKLLPPLMQIVQALLPPLMQIINALLPLIQPLVDLLMPIIDILLAVINPLVEIISTVLPPLVELLSTILQVILPPLTTAFQFLSGVIEGTFEHAMVIIQPIIDHLKGLFTGLTQFISGVFSGNWKKAWEGVKTIFKTFANTLGNVIKAPLNFIISGLNTFIKGLNKIKIPSWVPAVGGKGINIPVIPKLATGTNYVPEDMFAMIHEGEAVVPKKFNPYANNINPVNMSTMQSSNIRPIINVYNNMSMDPLGQVVSSVKTFSGGAKNDYNYGVGV